MKREHVIGVVLGFLAGNLTGTLATVAVFGADMRELKTKIEALDTRVATVEAVTRDVELELAATRGGVTQAGKVR